MLRIGWGCRVPRTRGGEDAHEGKEEGGDGRAAHGEIDGAVAEGGDDAESPGVAEGLAGAPEGEGEDEEEEGEAAFGGPLGPVVGPALSHSN